MKLWEAFDIFILNHGYVNLLKTVVSAMKPSWYNPFLQYKKNTDYTV